MFSFEKCGPKLTLTTNKNNRKRPSVIVSGLFLSTVGSRLSCFFLKYGFILNLFSDGVMRLNECEQVQRDLSEALGINLTVIDGAKEFLDGLKGVEDPEVRFLSCNC